ncbi:MAG TPA: hypothetical protein PLJ15_02870, partial [Candidatus Omnitrophota bacterium]|nr:hypothetical protein [Candidatus Omnitrophota bacterium]
MRKAYVLACKTAWHEFLIREARRALFLISSSGLLWIRNSIPWYTPSPITELIRKARSNFNFEAGIIWELLP